MDKAQKRKKIIIIIRIVLLAIIIIALWVGISVRRSMEENPLLFRSEETIRSSLLDTMPMGTNMEEFTSIVDNNYEWTIRHINEDFGVVLHPTLLIPMRDIPRGRPVIGAQSIEIDLGTYHFLTRIYVSSFMAFDEDGELIEIFVRREYDML